MSDQKDKTPYRHGRDKDEGYEPPPPPYGKDKDEGHEPPPYGRGRDEGYEPPPRYGKGGDEGCEPPPCPDPCDQDPPWGPPDIRPECCPDDRQCCPEDQHSRCTWDEVDDPCVRAASCGGDWTKIDCKCHSTNEDCDCEEWDCGCYPKGGCVPCKPCEGVLPEDDPNGECDDPPREDCTTTDLRRQLTALQHRISSQQGEKAKIEADILARQEREKDLKALVATFDDIVKTYKEKRQELICTEDCLKGFYRDTTRVFDKYKFPEGCQKKLEVAINKELCELEQEKCCEKNLAGKLKKVTKLEWEKQKAKHDLEEAQKAFQNLQTMAEWIGKQFKDLDDLKTKINTGLNSTDPNEHRWAFYLFYWKFVPQLCKRFPVAICCKKKKDGSEEPYQSAEHHHSGEHSTYHIGCELGDWHPSVITEKKLTQLICCAWDYVREQKEKSQEADGRVLEVENNLKYIGDRIKAHTDTLEQQLKNRLNAVDCKPAPCGD